MRAMLVACVLVAGCVERSPSGTTAEIVDGTYDVAITCADATCLPFYGSDADTMELDTAGTPAGVRFASASFWTAWTHAAIAGARLAIDDRVMPDGAIVRACTDDAQAVSGGWSCTWSVTLDGASSYYTMTAIGPR